MELIDDTPPTYTVLFHCASLPDNPQLLAIRFRRSNPFKRAFMEVERRFGIDYLRYALTFRGGFHLRDTDSLESLFARQESRVWLEETWNEEEETLKVMFWDPCMDPRTPHVWT